MLGCTSRFLGWTGRLHHYVFAFALDRSWENLSLKRRLIYRNALLFGSLGLPKYLRLGQEGVILGNGVFYFLVFPSVFLRTG